MRRSFTVIELLFVIIVIGILASLAIPRFQESYKQSLISKAQSKVTAIRSGIQVYKNKHILLGQSPLPTSLDKAGSSKLFENVLQDGVTPGTNAGEWQKINNSPARYKYYLNDGYIVFEYNNSNGKFLCKPNLSSSQGLCNYF